ncbi:MAG: T9SS type A sorting domain-containing protein [Prevotella sp.]
MEFYINQVPEALYVIIYEGNNIVCQQYVKTLRQYSFNTVHLDSPFKLNTDKELRVVIYVEHNEITVPLGYDEGPAKEGRGNLYSNDGTTWTTLSSDDVSIDGNWNISVGLSPYAESQLAAVTTPTAAVKALTVTTTDESRSLVSRIVAESEESTKNVLEGYNIYRNNEKLNNEYLSSTDYLDEAPYTSKYLVYKVSAVYSVSGEKFSDAVTVVASGIDGVTADSRLNIRVTADALLISNGRTGDPVTVYSASGAKVYSSEISDNYTHNIPTSAMPSGTYVVQVGDETFKFVVR